MHEPDEPLMDQDAVADEAKLRGIIVQTVADLGAQHSFDDIAKVVQQRSVDAGLNYASGVTTEVLRAVLTEAAAANENDGG